ncbi:hypothetical protein EON71_01005 [bacterium]|nr:MAG: hypothetical protein EON71_01005 [bacterium]
MVERDKINIEPIDSFKSELTRVQTYGFVDDRTYKSLLKIKEANFQNLSSDTIGLFLTLVETADFELKTRVVSSVNHVWSVVLISRYKNEVCFFSDGMPFLNRYRNLLTYLTLYNIIFITQQ